MELETITSNYIASILTGLTVRFTAEASRKWRGVLKGSEGRQALERCLHAGVVALLASARNTTSIQKDQLEDIFTEFFNEQDTIKALAPLLRGNSLDHNELVEIFGDLGYDESTLPGLDFDQGITLFETAFLVAATHEPLLQPIIQTGQLLEQSRIQRDLLDQVQKLVTFLQQVQPLSVSISNGLLTGQEIGIGGQIRHQLTGQTPSSSILLQLPPRADYFTNRETELAQLKNELQPGRVVTICGPGGIGKTALATELLWQLVSENQPPTLFPDGIIFHSFYNQPQADLALAEIARAFGEDPRNGTPATAAKRALAGRQALLVLDGAEDADDLPAVLAVRGGCGVLITTRQRRDALAIRQDLSPLEIDKAVTLLQSWAGEHAANDIVAAQICELVGRLPLAVRLVGRYLEQQEEEVIDYLNWLNETPLMALNQGQRQFDSVPLLLEKSVAQIDPDARQVLAVVGMLAFAPFKRQVIAESLNMSINQVRPLLGELVNYGLLVRVDKGYQVNHALVHTYARRRVAAKDGVIDRLAAYYETFAHKQSQLGVIGYVKLDPVRPHLMALLPKLVEQERWQAARSLVWAIDEYFNIQGYWTERITVIKVGLTIAQTLQDQQEEGLFFNNLANTWRDLGRVDLAIKYHQEALIISRQIGNQRNEGDYLGNLGMDFSYLEQWDQAIDCFEKSLTIAREIGDLQSEVYNLDSLGVAYREMRQINQAIDYYKQALVITEKIGDDKSEGNILGNLGVAYYHLGQPKQAIDYLKRALIIAQNSGDRRLQGSRLGDLGNVYFQLGKVTLAIKHYEEALALARQIGYRRGEIWHLGNLGYVYHHLGQIKRAIEYYETVIVICQEIGNRRSESRRIGTLGVAYYYLGQIEEAIKHIKQALSIAQDIGDARIEAAHLGRLGDTYLHLGQLKETLNSYQQAFDISLRISFKQGEGRSLGRLGNVYFDLGQILKAIDYHKQELSIVRQISHRAAEGRSLGHLGRDYHAQGKLGQAIRHYEQALAIAREIHARRDEATYLGNLGRLYRDLGQVQQAIDFNEQALSIAREISYRACEAVQLGNLADAYRDLGQIEQAISFYEQALTIAGEIDYRRCEALNSWNLGVLYEDSDPTQAVALMSLRVDYEREIGHPDAKTHAQRVIQIKKGV